MLSLRMEEHREAAARAGLRYVTDGVPGIRRQRAGTGWAFYWPDGERIADRVERRRISALAIPPAWTDVWICPDQAATSRRRRATRAAASSFYH